MIGRLRGVFADVEDDRALIDVMGVGYLVICGARTLARLPPLGEEVTLDIESQTREDGVRLYGFPSKAERQAFVMLQAIQGVGPKAALAVLDVLSLNELAAAVTRDDKAAVSRANGVGTKLAIRIVTELKGKAIGTGLTLPAHAGCTSETAPAGQPPTTSGEAVAALIGLGVAEPIGRRVVETVVVRLGPDVALPMLIKAALQELGR